MDVHRRASGALAFVGLAAAAGLILAFVATGISEAGTGPPRGPADHASTATTTEDNSEVVPRDPDLMAAYDQCMSDLIDGWPGEDEGTAMQAFLDARGDTDGAITLGEYADVDQADAACAQYRPSAPAHADGRRDR